MGRPSKGPKAMTPAQRMAASRARAKQTATAPVAEPEVVTPTSPMPTPAPKAPRLVTPRKAPVPLGSTLEELEAYAAIMKERASKPDASAADNGTFQRVLADLSKLRGDSFELTEGTIARSAAFRRYRDRIVEVLRPFPDALRVVRDAVAELEAQS